MQITGFDHEHEPARGIVLAHGPSREAMSARLALEPPYQPDAPYRPYYTFKARPLLRPGETIEAGRARFHRQRAAVEDARRALHAG